MSYLIFLMGTEALHERMLVYNIQCIKNKSFEKRFFSLKIGQKPTSPVMRNKGSITDGLMVNYK